jgi:3-keto-5-aminohexanoate cleavage enzyme
VDDAADAPRVELLDEALDAQSRSLAVLDDLHRERAGPEHVDGHTRLAIDEHVPHPLRPYEPLIINVALTGMVARRARVPALPVTVEQIVDDAVACIDAGATIVHLHARADDGSPAWERERFAPILAGIRQRRPEAVLCATTSGRDVADLDKRADVLDLEGDAAPDMASLTLGSLNFRRDVSINAPETIAGLAQRMRERGVRPELEIFDGGMAYLACDLLARGVLSEPLYANVILGGPNTAPATARALAAVVDALPRGTAWAAGGLGAFQRVANGLAAFMGGHVRTGLEDNPWLDSGRSRPATNVALVERAVELARSAGREVANCAQTRARLGL